MDGFTLDSLSDPQKRSTFACGIRTLAHGTEAMLGLSKRAAHFEFKVPPLFGSGEGQAKNKETLPRNVKAWAKDINCTYLATTIDPPAEVLQTPHKCALVWTMLLQRDAAVCFYI